jgi:hypothetical protein
MAACALNLAQRMAMPEDSAPQRAKNGIFNGSKQMK